VLDITIHKKQDEYKQNKKKHTTQYVLDIIIHKKQDEYKQNKKNTHNTICVGYHYTQETRRIQTKLKKHTQHNMCWTSLYTRNKTNTNKIKKKHKTQYVLDIIIHKKQDEYKQN
jgi:hypothetical protein